MSETAESSIESLLQPKEAAKLLNLSTSWLAKARRRGEGPDFVKIGRAVRYPPSALGKFIRLRMHKKMDSG
jgi:predicted DNA-binding transcriptional regulator AlpA